jgi:hypothetical protein
LAALIAALAESHSKESSLMQNEQYYILLVETRDIFSERPRSPMAARGVTDASER